MGNYVQPDYRNPPALAADSLAGSLGATDNPNHPHPHYPSPSGAVARYNQGGTNAPAPPLPGQLSTRPSSIGASKIVRADGTVVT